MKAGATGLFFGCLVKPGANDYEVVPAVAATDLIIGVCIQPDAAGAPAVGDRVDVMWDGIADVKIGGTVTRGNEITANGTGQGVAAAPGAGTNNRIVGVALQSGVANDVIEVILSVGLKQG
jgi:hypothetical protein